MTLHRDGKVTLSPQVLRLDDRRPIYHRPRSTSRGHDLFFMYLMPAAVLVFFALCMLVVYWLVVAIERALRGGA